MKPTIVLVHGAFAESAGWTTTHKEQPGNDLLAPELTADVSALVGLPDRKRRRMSTDATTPDTIVLIHGFWVTPRSWEDWKARYESRGYRVLHLHTPASRWRSRR